MDEKQIFELKIDPGFRNLIRPLHRAEYLQLESSIISEGCRDPIITWNSYIIDGHNRYEICFKHKIPFRIVKMEFQCREAAIAWICAHQLSRKNISEETRKFLIGLQYESEKIVTKMKNTEEVHPHSPEYISSMDPTTPVEVKAQKQFLHETAIRIAEKNHIASGTVQKYAAYTRSLQAIGQMDPDLVPKILSGRYKISHKNIVELSKLDREGLRSVIRRIDRAQQPYIQYSRTRREIQQSTSCLDSSNGSPLPSVKDMPPYDPDAEIIGLALTIPSWTSSLDRARNTSNLGVVSKAAKEKLLATLSELHCKILDLLSAIKED